MSKADSSHPPDAFADAFGEPIRHVLDLNTWNEGHDLATLYDRLNQMVSESVAQEKRTRDPIRQLIFPRLRNGNDRFAPKNAGLYKVTPEQIAEIHRGLLFNGATECCDGTIAAHNSLLLTVVQIGLSLVAYKGSQGTWVQRLYCRDLQVHSPDPVEEALALLERRSKPGDTEDGEERAPLNRLLRRTLMEYAERAALANLSSALWRMGHGNPVPLNLLLPSTPELVRAGVEAMQALLLDHRRFVYVASDPADRLLLTIGNALNVLEFAIVGTLESQINAEKLAASQSGHPRERDLIQAFVRAVGPEIVSGVYRAGLNAPARVFYAHRDFACEAAALAIADSVLQPYRGFPMLIDLADIVCGNVFDQASFHGTVQNAYARAGEPMRYLGERETRA